MNADSSSPGSGPVIGWTTVCRVDLPIVQQSRNAKLIPVKLAEKYILSYFPNVLPENLRHVPPLACVTMKTEEADLLRNILLNETFSTGDPMVDISHFLLFFEMIQQAYPRVVVPSFHYVPGGWILVCGSIIPHVDRDGVQFLPLNVVRGASGLFSDEGVKTVPATRAEIQCLNKLCMSAGMDFLFVEPTDLIDIGLVSLSYPEYPITQLTRMLAGSLFVPGETSGNATPAVKSSLGSLQVGTSPGHEFTAEQVVPRVQNVSSRPIQALKTLVSAPYPGPSLNNSSEASNHTVPHPEPVQQASTCITLDDQCTPQASTSPENTNQPLKHKKRRRKLSLDKPRQKYSVQTKSFLGKIMHSVHRETGHKDLVPIEVVHSTYFPQCSLVDMLNYIAYNLTMPLYNMKKDEEEELASLLMTDAGARPLRCNKLVALSDLESCYVKLFSRFGNNTQIVPKAASSGVADVQQLPKLRTELDENQENEQVTEIYRFCAGETRPEGAGGEPCVKRVYSNNSEQCTTKIHVPRIKSTTTHTCGGFVDDLGTASCASEVPPLKERQLPKGNLR